MASKQRKEANMATKLKPASTRHFTVEADTAVALGTGLGGISPEISEVAFTGEPEKMVKAVARWAKKRKLLDPTFDVDGEVEEWAMREGRGHWNPDPGRYQRNADLVVA